MGKYSNITNVLTAREYIKNFIVVAVMMLTVFSSSVIIILHALGVRNYSHFLIGAAVILLSLISGYLCKKFNDFNICDSLFTALENLSQLQEIVFEVNNIKDNESIIDNNYETNFKIIDNTIDLKDVIKTINCFEYILHFRMRDALDVMIIQYEYNVYDKLKYLLGNKYLEYVSKNMIYMVDDICTINIYPMILDIINNAKIKNSKIIYAIDSENSEKGYKLHILRNEEK